MSGAQSKRSPSHCLPDGYAFGKYKIVRLIAVGGMSEVYEAIHSGLDKRVALKVLRPDLAENLEAQQRFVCEGINAARIRHTHVVDVTDVGIVDDLPYLVMSLLDGEDLGQIYERHGRLPVPDLIDLLLPVASAIAVGHAHGIVHRDLKPDNIFLHHEGCRVIPKVLDFGVSRAMDARRITQGASVFGTPQYMSPEQGRGAQTDERTDQYALGVILYEGLTGHLPRDNANPLELLHSLAFDTFRRPSEHVPLPSELEAVILRAMAHDPANRFPSMRELAVALLPFASASAREYWGVELSSMAEDEAGLEFMSFARHPSHPPHPSPLFVPAERSPSHSVAVDVAVPPPPPQPPAPALARVTVPALDSLQPQVAEVAAQAPKQRTRRVFWAGTLAGVLLGLGLAWFGVQTTTERPVTTTSPASDTRARYYDVAVDVTPPTAAVLLDGVQVGVGSYRSRLPQNGVVHELRASADGYITRSVSFRDEPPPPALHLTPHSAPPQIAALPAPTTPAGDEVEPESKTTGPRKRVWLPKPKRRAEPKEVVNEVSVIEAPAPKIRIVDEYRPRIRVID